MQQRPVTLLASRELTIADITPVSSYVNVNISNEIPFKIKRTFRERTKDPSQ